jgi:hypothetical protein
MAGGMNRRANYGTMAERVAATGQADATPEPPRIRHCFVTDRYGRLPALLLEWQRRADRWHGRVVRPVLEGDGWAIVEEWLTAELLDPG